MLPKEIKSKGGIIIPETNQDKQQAAREVGIFVTAGGNAFTEPTWPKEYIPRPGMRVLFDRYAGSMQKGKDGKEYRLLNDKEIGAIVEDDYGN